MESHRYQREKYLRWEDGLKHVGLEAAPHKQCIVDSLLASLEVPFGLFLMLREEFELIIQGS